VVAGWQWSGERSGAHTDAAASFGAAAPPKKTEHPGNRAQLRTSIILYHRIIKIKGVSQNGEDNQVSANSREIWNGRKSIERGKRNIEWRGSAREKKKVYGLGNI
jgi:hypothetical protein